MTRVSWFPRKLSRPRRQVPVVSVSRGPEVAETLQGRKSGAERDSADHAAEQARSARNVNRRDRPRVSRRLTLMLGMAAENAAAGNLYQACVPLGWGETLSQNL